MKNFKEIFDYDFGSREALIANTLTHRQKEMIGFSWLLDIDYKMSLIKQKMRLLSPHFQQLFIFDDAILDLFLLKS